MRGALRLAFVLTTGVAAAAPGDWRGDAPGVTHRIDLAALPAPYATRSASDAPSVVARPAGAMPRAPEGLAVSVFADGLDGPRQIRVAPDGRVFVAETAAGRVLTIAPGEPPRTFVDGLDGPFGMAFYPAGAPKWVYVAENNRVVRFPYTGGTAAVIIPRIARTTGYHTTRDLVVSPDGDLLLSVGSGSNVSGDRVDAGVLAAHDASLGVGAAWGSETGRAAVRRFAPDGVGGLKPYANGLRNCVGMAVAGRDVWCAVNERDGLGDDLPPDFVTRVRAGAFFGWPWFYLGGHADPRTDAPPPGLTVTVPDVPIQPHSAPLGVTVAGDDVFVALHGSWNRSSRAGYKVVRIHAPGGVPDGSYEDFLTGFVLNDEHVWGRPVGVAVAADGALLVSDDAGGVIWRVGRIR